MNASTLRPSRKVPATGGADVAHPLRDASGRHEVAHAVDLEEVDDGRAHLTRAAPAHLEDAGSLTLRPSFVIRAISGLKTRRVNAPGSM